MVLEMIMSMPERRTRRRMVLRKAESEMDLLRRAPRKVPRGTRAKRNQGADLSWGGCTCRWGEGDEFDGVDFGESR